jgi:hypothetical protein
VGKEGAGGESVMLMLVCKCGQSGPFPTEDISLNCTRCKRQLVIRTFRTEAAWRTEQQRRAKAGEQRMWRAEWRPVSPDLQSQPISAPQAQEN